MPGFLRDELRRRNLSLVDGEVPLVLEEFIGAGGVGEVYRVKRNAETLALKWCFPQPNLAELRGAMTHLSAVPSSPAQFLWPRSVIATHDLPGFGYLMPFREPRFVSLQNLLDNTVKIRWRERLTAAIELTLAFEYLHEQNLVWGDLASENVCVSPRTGEIVFSDIDGLVRPGIIPNYLNPSPRFMSPKVFKPGASVSIATNRYTLAVLLFCLLAGRHPAEDMQQPSMPLMGLGEMRAFYARCNRALDPGAAAASPLAPDLAAWNMLPLQMRTTFLRILHAAGSQNDYPTETQWAGELFALRDRLAICRRDATEYFEDTDANQSPLNTACPTCLEFAAAHWSITFQSRAPATPIHLSLDAMSRIYERHLQPDGRWNTIVASAQSHPTHHDLMGLKNETTRAWESRDSAGNTKIIEPGRVLALADDMKISLDGDNCTLAVHKTTASSDSKPHLSTRLAKRIQRTAP